MSSSRDVERCFLSEKNYNERINDEILGVKGLRNGKNAISESIETHDLVKVTVFSTDSFNGFRLERGHALKSHSQQQQNMFS